MSTRPTGTPSGGSAVITVSGGTGLRTTTGWFTKTTSGSGTNQGCSFRSGIPPAIARYRSSSIRERGITRINVTIPGVAATIMIGDGISPATVTGSQVGIEVVTAEVVTAEVVTAEVAMAE